MVVVAVGAAQAEVQGVGRFAGDLDAVGPALLGGLRPVRAQVVAQPGDVLEDDGELAVDQSAHLEPQRRGGALGDVAGRDVEVLRRGLADVRLGDLVEFEMPRPAAS